jgi:hypothetical protein
MIERDRERAPCSIQLIAPSRILFLIQRLFVVVLYFSFKLNKINLKAEVAAHEPH